MRTTDAQFVPSVSIVVATRNRGKGLAALLTNLERLKPPTPLQTIVADNGSSDETPQMLKVWATAGERRRVLTVEHPGKSRALNAALGVAQGEIVAFLDDDVAVDSDYLAEVSDHFLRHDDDAAQGPILWPAAALADERLCAWLAAANVVPRVELRPGQAVVNLVGANMAVRREALHRVGGFNERLGPGASGFSEDDDLTRRIRALGGRIGYMAGARVTHEIDRDRLTDAYCLERIRRIARSRVVVEGKRLSSARIWFDLAKVSLDEFLYGVAGTLERKYRAKTKTCYYREMWNLARQRNRR